MELELLVDGEVVDVVDEVVLDVLVDVVDEVVLDVLVDGEVVDVVDEVLVEDVVVDVVVDVDELELVTICDPHLVPLYTAAIVVGPVIVIATGSAVLPLMLPPDQWLKVHEP